MRVIERTLACRRVDSSRGSFIAGGLCTFSGHLERNSVAYIWNNLQLLLVFHHFLFLPVHPMQQETKQKKHYIE